LLIQLDILGVVIGFNNFATALALGAVGVGKRVRRILTVFAAFEFTVPLIGLWLGQNASRSVIGASSWLGAVLLMALGLLTVFQSTREARDTKVLAAKITTWRGLVFLSAGLSIDNLVVGFSLGLRGIPALSLATTIMAFSVTFAWIGLTIGGRGRRNYEKLTEAMAGILLLALAGAQGTGVL
jgi:putative Mn2+ efflux pump MntP